MSDPDRVAEAGTDRLEAVLERLRSRRLEDRKDALWELTRLADPRSRPAVAAALEDRNEDVRTRAAYLLETLGGIEELLAALQHDDPGVREAAVLGLAASEDARAAPALAGRVTDPSPKVRSQAVWHLVRGGTDLGMETALQVALGADEKPLRQRATQALEGFGNLNLPFLLRVLEHPPVQDPEKARSIAATALMRNPHPDAVEPLSRLLESSEGKIRETAAYVLGQTGDPRTLPVLRRALEIQDPRLQKEAALALANLRDHESAGKIRELLSSRNMHVLVGAIQALGRLGDLDSVEAIGRAASDPQHLVRLAAVEVLPWLAGADPRVIRHLCAALRDEHPKVRLAAAGGLSHHGHPEALPALEERLRRHLEPDAQVRELARKAISQIREAHPGLPEVWTAAKASPPVFTGRVTQYDPDLSPVGAIPTALTCENCGGPCHELLVVPGEQIGRPGRTYQVIRCLNCYFEGPYFVHYQNGQPTGVSYEYAEDQEFMSSPRDPSPRASIRWTPGAPDREADYRDWKALAGGHPEWAQNAEWPQCHACGEDMEFILQLASFDLDSEPLQDEPGLRVALWIEHYATLYFFHCPACEITASISQCS